MNEAPENIFLLPKDAALFGQKYGHPDVQQVYVGDESVEYIRADLARPVTVAEAAKVLLDAKYTSIRLAFDAMEAVESEGVEQIFASALLALSHEGGE